MEGNLRFKIDWASLIVGMKFTVFALFYFSLFEGNFRVQAPGGLYIWRGDLTEGFLHYEFGGQITLKTGAYERKLVLQICKKSLLRAYNFLKHSLSTIKIYYSREMNISFCAVCKINP